MKSTARLLEDRDLRCILDVLVGGAYDRGKMIRMLREDAEILEGMLSDDKLLQYVLTSPEKILTVSPQLFFTVLLYRVRKALRETPYTIEKSRRHVTYLFDADKVKRLLNDSRMMAYLSNMLVSFVKINSISFLTKDHGETWRRVRFSDFDIDTLREYAETLDRENRLYCYKRIADICLFILGVFPEYIVAGELPPESEITVRPSRKGRTRDDYEEKGRYFYGAAAEIAGVTFTDLAGVLHGLAENFSLAVKPLDYMSNHYLGFVKKQVFMKE